MIPECVVVPKTEATPRPPTAVNVYLIVGHSITDARRMMSQRVTTLTTTVMALTFDKSLVLRYLGLPEDYSPAPEIDPIGFLNRHLFQLPPNIVRHFSSITTPKQRTLLIPIRNRRFRYVNSCPPELRFVVARNSWPGLWQGRERSGIEEGKEERLWAQNEFLGGAQQHVGQLGNLLGGYEEEREAERVRHLREGKVFAEDDESVPEEEDSEDEEEGNRNMQPPEQETDEQVKDLFERRIRGRFIYGLLDNVDYDKIDWDESLGEDEDRDAEERWFENEE